MESNFPILSPLAGVESVGAGYPTGALAIAAGVDALSAPFDGLALLRCMALSREGDRREGILFRQGQGWIQVPGAGHEGLAALNPLLGPHDLLFPYYRERALMLARGISNYEMALAFFACQGSCSEGRQMPSHYSSRELGVVASAVPIGIQCLPAAGAAWGLKMQGQGGVALCFIGDAGLRQGEFYEALCMALQDELPVIFVVEDNGYGISTPTAGMTPWAIGALDGARLKKVDGRDPLAVYEAGADLVASARSGGGPSVLWMELDRLWSHTASDDHRVYRSPEEISGMARRDPITLWKERLVAAGLLTEAGWLSESRAIEESVRQDYERAAKVALPKSPATNLEMESLARAAKAAPRTRPSAPKAPTEGATEPESETMLGTLNALLHRRLAEEPRTIIFGQDVADPKGGVFGVTRGLSTAYPGRVVNSPLAEATIVGAAAGLALSGYRPIFEIQFIDFIGPAYNQFVNQLATLRWRSAGDWVCPTIFMAPCGAYLPGGGPWHSQSNEALLAHIPGLLVACPSTPSDIESLMAAAFEIDDPVIFFLPKHLLRARHAPVPASAAGLGFGRASVRREGHDVTVVGWGNTVPLSLAAADRLAESGIECEVLDLRTIVPCDWDTIFDSLVKTGRLVVVHEDNMTCGFGATIIARAVTDPEWWSQLAAPPQLVARPDAHIPYQPVLELSLLPSVEKVVAAVKATLTE